jgi:hypothetical protein
MLIHEQNIQKQKFFIETDMPLSVTWLMMSKSNFYCTAIRCECQTEVSARDISWRWKPVCRAADCLEILGASTSWSLKGLSRPVMG